MMMSVWGERPLAFPDGGAAWNWLETVANGTFTGQLPELALMDIRMPGYTGDKVAARIRQTPALKDIPIILMTAFSLSDVEIKQMMDQAGIDHLINKPLPDMDVFKSTLYRIRDERRARLAKRAELAAQQNQPNTEATAQPATATPATSPAPNAAPSTPTQQPAAKPADKPAEIKPAQAAPTAPNAAPS